MISYVPQGNFLLSGSIRDAVHFWQGERVEDPALVPAAIARMLAAPGPYLLDVAISREQNVYPMVAPGDALGEVIGAIDVAVGAVRLNMPEAPRNAAPAADAEEGDDE